VILINQYDTVLIEQSRITFKNDLMVSLVLERQPGCPIRQRIGIHFDRNIKRRPHA